MTVLAKKDLVSRHALLCKDGRTLASDKSKPLASKPYSDKMLHFIRNLVVART